MLEWLTVLLLLVFGLILLLLEILFVPGATLIGLLGILSGIFGIYLGYSYFGATVGTFILGGTALIAALAIYRGFKARTWERLTLKLQINSRVNENESVAEVGQRGRTLSALRPMGTAELGGERREVRTFGTFLPANTSVEIVRIEGKKIWVEEVKQTDEDKH